MPKIRLALTALLLLACLLAPPAAAQRPTLSADRFLHLTPTGAASTLNNGLVAFWKLDEASGTRYDAVGSNHLTDVNTVGQADGKIGKAALFVAANDEYLSIADNADLSMGDIDFTVALWLYLDNKDDNRYPIGKRSSTSFEYHLAFPVVTDRLRFYVSSDGTIDGLSSVYADSFGSPPTTTWMLVIMWHSADDNKIYIRVNNGPIDSADHSGGVWDGNAQFRLGTLELSVEYLDGRMDAVGIWKRLLTADEQDELWDNGDGKEYPF